MSFLMGLATTTAGQALLSYVVTKVVGRLTEKWWGRALVAVLRIINERGGKSADADLIERLEKVEKLNAEQLAKLDQDEQDVVNHKNASNESVA